MRFVCDEGSKIKATASTQTINNDCIIMGVDWDGGEGGISSECSDDEARLKRFGDLDEI